MLQPTDSNGMMTRFGHFLNEFYRESDRGAAIFAASWLDAFLTTVLKEYLIEGESTGKLFSVSMNGPLQSFGNKLNLAFSLGLISEREYKDCTIISNIRNKFGHRFDLDFSFDTHQIAELCQRLNTNVEDREPVVAFAGTNRECFNNCVFALHMRFMVRPPHARNRRPIRPDWDALMFDQADSPDVGP